MNTIWTGPGGARTVAKVEVWSREVPGAGRGAWAEPAAQRPDLKSGSEVGSQGKAPGRVRLETPSGVDPRQAPGASLLRAPEEDERMRNVIGS